MTSNFTPAGPLPPDFLLSVVIPVYNEVQTIEIVLALIQHCKVPCEVIIVDDGSTDGTREYLEKLRDTGYLPRSITPKYGYEPDFTQLSKYPCPVHILFHERNRGKGAALRTGFAAAKGTAVVVQDADLEYDPGDFRQLVAPLAAGEADIVYGSRFLSRQPVTDAVHAFGNQLVTWISNFKTGLSLTDVETCYKLIRREALLEILPKLHEEGFAIELELTRELAKMPWLRWREVPIRYLPRSWGSGKKLGILDVLWTFWCAIRY